MVIFKKIKNYFFRFCLICFKFIFMMFCFLIDIGNNPINNRCMIMLVKFRFLLFHLIFTNAMQAEEAEEEQEQEEQEEEENEEQKNKDIIEKKMKTISKLLFKFNFSIFLFLFQFLQAKFISLIMILKNSDDIWSRMKSILEKLK